tara:strand:+ start:426 stop:671 length:246 start_codon:yes stop_codon:yes gene_type:complete
MFLRKKDFNSTPLKFGAISKEDLLRMGAESIAYIKKSEFGEGEEKFSIYSANGDLIAEDYEDFESAVSELKSHNIYCATVQ